MSLGILELENNPEVQKAYDYFSVLRTSETASANDESKTVFSGVNSYGMVDFIQMFNKEASFTAGEDDNLTAVMESLNNILIAAVLEHAGTDEKEQVASKNWREGFNAMASMFCSTYSVDELTYSDKKVGKEVVEEVIKVGFDVDGQPEGNLKTAIQKYLEKQGKLLGELSFDEAHHSNPYTMIGFVNFSKGHNHTCGLRAYFTTFDTDTVRIRESCKDDKKTFNFNFKVTRCNADFKLANWNSNAKFRKEVKKFIKEHRPRSPYFDIVKTSNEFTIV